MTLDTFRLIAVQPGTFRFGCPDPYKQKNWGHAYLDMTISRPFRMLANPVTQRQWLDVMGTRPWDDLNEYDRDILQEGDLFPAINISWVQATQFCEALSEQAKTLVRLPTEVEWEYCCRAGTQTDYYWGDEDDEIDESMLYAWTDDNSNDQIQKVCQLKPNAWGFYDMLGNVTEVVRDRCNQEEEGVHMIYHYKQEPDFVATEGMCTLLRGGGAVYGVMKCYSSLLQHHARGVRHAGFRFIVEEEA